MLDDNYYINEVLQGRKAAYVHIVNNYQNYVFTICYRVLKHREEAEEAAQDTFVKCYKTLPSFNKKSKFSTWLYRIAQNTAIDYSRKKQHITHSIDDDERFFNVKDDKNKGQFEQLKANQRLYYIERIIKGLPAVDANLITLFYLNEKSIGEIIQITGFSKANVKVKLFRLRKKMKQMLEDFLQQEAKELL